jgi:hypothetical protein
MSLLIRRIPPAAVPFHLLLVTFITALLPAAPCAAQHLWWDKDGQEDATCLYGETIVLATMPGFYYSSAGWWPGEAAGGYCGIQHNRPTERRTIFSIWDTSPTLHPAVTEADRRTFFGRFGGEGEGGHTHMRWDWREREVFRFFLRKQPGQAPDTTDARYYIYDSRRKTWIHSGTITSPNDNKPKIVGTIGGGLNSFLENFAGADKAVPKLALYSLWLGPQPDQLRCLTKCGGDGIWGQLDGRYFLAEGDMGRLRAVFTRLEKDYGRPVFGAEGKELPRVPDRPLPASLIAELKALPRADAVNAKSHAPADGKRYTVRSLKSGKFLAVKGGSQRAGTDLVQDNTPERPTAWRLEAVGGDGFRIVSPGNNLVADATADAARLQPRRRGEADAQVWTFVKVDDAYHIASKRDARVMDVEGNSDDDGARVILYARNADKPAANQLWVLTEVQK